MDRFIDLEQHGWPIFNPAYARGANPKYFKAFLSTQPGTNKAILGNVVADQPTRSSYMIIRRSHREPHYSMQMQAMPYGSKPNYYQRALYKTARSDYVIARQTWADGAVHELHTFDTAQEARASFKLITGRGFSDYVTE